MYCRLYFQLLDVNIIFILLNAPFLGIDRMFRGSVQTDDKISERKRRKNIEAEEMYSPLNNMLST